MSEANEALDAISVEELPDIDEQTIEKINANVQPILEAARDDQPIWQDWSQFWQRSQAVVVAIANIYHPEVKYPLLNIYIPQAYGLIRGTVDDVDHGDLYVHGQVFTATIRIPGQVVLDCPKVMMCPDGFFFHL